MIHKYDPIVQSLLASLFTWAVTALGASLCFVLPSNNKKFLDVSLGFAGGVMTAASFWSLLAPAIEISENTLGKLAFIPVAIGFALGALFVHLSDRLIPSCVNQELSLIDAIRKCEGHNTASSGQILRSKNSEEKKRVVLPPKDSDSQRMLNENGLKINSPQNESTPNEDDSSVRKDMPDSIEVAESSSLNVNLPGSPDSSYLEKLLSWRRILLLIMAVTVHNIPEGLAVGVGFGSIGKTPAATFEKAFNLALGIGLQNFPEGLAVSLPLTGFGYSKIRAFLYGQASGMVEPIAAILGASMVLLVEPILPYALSFAAGAMIYVVFDDIVPEAQRNGNGKLASLGAISGFLVMMCLDVGLG